MPLFTKNIIFNKSSSMQGIWWSICLHIRQILTQLSINGHKQKAKSKKQKKRDGLRYREFVLSPYGVIKIKSLGYMNSTGQPTIGNTWAKARALVTCWNAQDRSLVVTMPILASRIFRIWSALASRSRKLTKTAMRLSPKLPVLAAGFAWTPAKSRCCMKSTVRTAIAKRHYFDNSQLCFFAAYQGIGCNHF